MESESETAAPVSQLLEEALDGEVATVGDLVDRTAEGGFALLLLLLTLPMLVPALPPGAPAGIGVLLTLLGIQMLAGRKTPLLPERIRRIVLPSSAHRLLRARGLVVLRRLESMTRVRPPASRGRLAEGVAGSTVLTMGAVMVLPIPFMNLPPALAVMMVALGISGRDGRFLWIGVGAAATILLGLAGAVAGMVWWGQQWFGR